MNSSLYSAVGTPGTAGAYVMLNVASGYSGATIRYFEDSSKNMGYVGYTAPTNIIPEIYWLEFDTNDVSGTTLVNRGSSGSSYTATIPAGVDICLNSIESIEGSGSLQLNNLATGATKINYLQLSSMTSPTSFSVSMWIKPTLNDTNQTFWQYTNGSYSTTGIYIGSQNNKWNIWVNNMQSNTINFQINDGNWHQLVIIYNNGTTVFYIDTVLLLTITSQIISGAIGNNRIGSASWLTTAESDYTLNGYMDDFRFYNRALSATEISTIYNYVKSVQYTVSVSGGSLYLRKFSGYAVLNPTITFRAGYSYIFDQSDSTNANNQIVFSRLSSGNPILTATDGVSIFGTPGTSGAYTRLVLSSTFTGTLYYLSYSNVATFNSVITSTGAKFYYSSDSSANYVTSGSNVTLWKNKVMGGLDASANIDGGLYPQVATTYTGGTFKYPMIKILNTVGNNTGFNHYGGGKLSTEPNQQTFFIFGYMYGQNPNTSSNGMFLAKPGAFGGGSLHIGYDGESIDTQYKFTIGNGGDLTSRYHTPNKFNNGLTAITGTNGYYMLSATIDCSGTNKVVNCHAYPNMDISFNDKIISDQNRTTDLHNLNIGYWNQGGISRSLNSAMGEVMYFNRKLSDNERYILEGKVAWKYDVSFILPSFHPYRNSAPV
jgi:hypothetical protein